MFAKYKLHKKYAIKIMSAVIFWLLLKFSLDVKQLLLHGEKDCKPRCKGTTLNSVNGQSEIFYIRLEQGLYESECGV